MRASSLTKTGASAQRPMDNQITWRRALMSDGSEHTVIRSSIRQNAVCSVIRSWIRQNSVRSAIRSWIRQNSVRSVIRSWIRQNSVRSVIRSWIRQNSVRSVIRSWIRQNSVRSAIRSWIRQNSVRSVIRSWIRQPLAFIGETNPASILFACTRFEIHFVVRCVVMDCRARHTSWPSRILARLRTEASLQVTQTGHLDFLRTV